MKFLIIKPSSLGDIVNALMVAQSLKEQSPTASLSWVAQDRFAPVVEGFHHRPHLPFFGVMTVFATA